MTAAPRRSPGPPLAPIADPFPSTCLPLPLTPASSLEPSDRSADEKYLVCQGGSPEWNAVLFLWEKGKVVHSARMSTPTVPVKSVSFSPRISSAELGVFSVAGSGMLRRFRLDASGVTELPSDGASRSQQTFTCQCYVGGGGGPEAAEGEGEEGAAVEAAEEPALVVGTDQGEMMVLHGSEVVQLLARSDGPGAITALCPFSRGFVAGGTGGMVCVVERVEGDGEGGGHFVVAKQLAVGRGHGTVVGVSVSPSEDAVLVATSDNQLHTVWMECSDEGTVGEVEAEPFLAAFHAGAVTGLDTCARKPLVATCSSNGSVRVWNYEEATCELQHDFVEEAFSLALHPSGYLLLVGFADKLRLMTVLMDDLRVIKEFNIKACRECQFSNGGHFLAAVNGSTISIYNTYTGENVSNLRGHNGKVNSLVWSWDDLK